MYDSLDQPTWSPSLGDARPYFNTLSRLKAAYWPDRFHFILVWRFDQKSIMRGGSRWRIKYRRWLGWRCSDFRQVRKKNSLRLLIIATLICFKAFLYETKSDRRICIWRWFTLTFFSSKIWFRANQMSIYDLMSLAIHRSEWAKKPIIIACILKACTRLNSEYSSGLVRRSAGRFAHCTALA